MRQQPETQEVQLSPTTVLNLDLGIGPLIPHGNRGVLSHPKVLFLNAKRSRLTGRNLLIRYPTSPDFLVLPISSFETVTKEPNSEIFLERLYPGFPGEGASLLLLLPLFVLVNLLSCQWLLFPCPRICQ